MIRAVVIDDEVNSRDSIRQMLELYCTDIIVVGQADGVKTGIECIAQNEPDLVFLDIRMGDGTGFDLLHKIDQITFKVVFVTAYEEYAIKAFKFNALDYITKPIDIDELRLAVEKATSVANDDSLTDRIKLLLQSVSKNSPQANKKLVLRTSNTIHVVEIDRIIRCESARNYTTFFLDEDETVMIAKSMIEFEEMLEEYGFLRVHHSHLINLNFVRKFMKDDLICVLTDNTNIPISYRRKDDLLRALKLL